MKGFTDRITKVGQSKASNISPKRQTTINQRTNLITIVLDFNVWLAQCQQISWTERFSLVSKYLFRLVNF